MIPIIIITTINAAIKSNIEVTLKYLSNSLRAESIFLKSEAVNGVSLYDFNMKLVIPHAIQTTAIVIIPKYLFLKSNTKENVKNIMPAFAINASGDPNINLRHFIKDLLFNISIMTVTSKGTAKKTIVIPLFILSLKRSLK